MQPFKIIHSIEIFIKKRETDKNRSLFKGALYITNPNNALFWKDISPKLLPCTPALFDPPPKIFVPFKMTPWNQHQQKTGTVKRLVCRFLGGKRAVSTPRNSPRFHPLDPSKSTMHVGVYAMQWILWVRENVPQHVGSNFWTLPCCWSGHAGGGGKEAISGKTCRWSGRLGRVLGLKQHQTPGRVSWNVGFGYLVGVFSDVFKQKLCFL